MEDKGILQVLGVAARSHVPNSTKFCTAWRRRLTLAVHSFTVSGPQAREMNERTPTTRIQCVSRDQAKL